MDIYGMGESEAETTDDVLVEENGGDGECVRGP